jgi:hypothetical protein
MMIFIFCLFLFLFSFSECITYFVILFVILVVPSEFIAKLIIRRANNQEKGTNLVYVPTIWTTLATLIHHMNIQFAPALWTVEEKVSLFYNDDPVNTRASWDTFCSDWAKDRANTVLIAESPKRKDVNDLSGKRKEPSDSHSKGKKHKVNIFFIHFFIFIFCYLFMYFTYYLFVYLFIYLLFIYLFYFI